LATDQAADAQNISHILYGAIQEQALQRAEGLPLADIVAQSAKGDGWHFFEWPLNEQRNLSYIPLIQRKKSKTFQVLSFDKIEELHDIHPIPNIARKADQVLSICFDEVIQVIEAFISNFAIGIGSLEVFRVEGQILQLASWSES